MIFYSIFINVFSLCNGGMADILFVSIFQQLKRIFFFVRFFQMLYPWRNWMNLEPNYILQTSRSLLLSAFPSPCANRHSLGLSWTSRDSRLEKISLSGNSHTPMVLWAASTYPTPTTRCPSAPVAKRTATTPAQPSAPVPPPNRISSNWVRFPGEA